MNTQANLVDIILEFPYYLLSDQSIICCVFFSCYCYESKNSFYVGVPILQGTNECVLMLGVD